MVVYKQMLDTMLKSMTTIFDDIVAVDNHQFAETQADKLQAVVTE